MKSILIIAFLFFLNCSLYSAFQKSNNWNARAAAFGGAYTSLADDASAPVYNTAGLGFMAETGFLVSCSKPFAGVDDHLDINCTYFSFALPLKSLGAFGLGYQVFDTDGLYNESVAILSYAAALNKIISWDKEMAFGINIKYLSHDFLLDDRTRPDPVFSSGREKSAVGMDTGFLVKHLFDFAPDLAIGFFIININEPDMGLQNSDPVYREYRLGFSQSFDKGMPDKISFLPSLDLILRDNEINIGGGLETGFFNRLLCLRAGGNFNELALGLGTENGIKNIFIFSFNYAFVYPFFLKGGYGSHLLTLTVNF